MRCTRTPRERVSNGRPGKQPDAGADDGLGYRSAAIPALRDDWSQTNVRQSRVRFLGQAPCAYMEIMMGSGRGHACGVGADRHDRCGYYGEPVLRPCARLSEICRAPDAFRSKACNRIRSGCSSTPIAVSSRSHSRFSRSRTRRTKRRRSPFRSGRRWCRAARIR